MKTGKILPFFIILLGSLVLIGAIQLTPNHQKFIGINFEDLTEEATKNRWSQVNLGEGAQWSDIQISERQFDWTLMDKAYQHAKSNNLIFRWDLSLKTPYLPKWLKEMPKQKQAQAKVGYVDNLIEELCGRYGKLDYISVESENWRETVAIGDQIKELCPNTKFLASYKKEQILSKEINDEFQMISYMKESSLIEGVNIQLTQIKKLQISLGEVEKIFTELDNIGIEVHVSGLTVGEISQADQLRKIFVFLIENPHVKSVAIKSKKNTEWFKSSNEQTEKEFFTWIHTNYLSLNQKKIQALNHEGSSLEQYSEEKNEGFGAMGDSHQNVRLLATTASFTYTADKFLAICNGSNSKAGGGAVIISYNWAWGDGTSNNITNGSSMAYHTYTTAATYPVILTITENTTKTDPVTVNVKIIGNLAPTAAFTQTISAYTVTATSTSTDSDGVVSSWAWNWGDNSTIDTTANPTHTYALAGTYTITLTVKD